MSTRLKIRHRSVFRYDTEVHASYNEVRLSPVTTPNQLVLESEVRVTPRARIFQYWDYWGSLVAAFDVHEPHLSLAVISESLVETSLLTDDGDAAPVGWEMLASEAVRDRHAELLAPSRYVPLSIEVLEVAERLARGLEPADAARASTGWVGEAMTYVPGATGVHTSATEAWLGGQGVCQDFAHLSLAILRAMGIPARYCSGYLHPSAEAGVGETVNGDSHAWVEAWIGAWLPLDPTIQQDVGERHVLVGRGRDYADVTPIKGIYRGGTSSALDVSVELTRLS